MPVFSHLAFLALSLPFSHFGIGLTRNQTKRSHMRPVFLVFYGGPDQIMGITSGIATIVGLALMFWNKLVVAFGKITNRFHPAPHTGETPDSPAQQEGQPR